MYSMSQEYILTFDLRRSHIPFREREDFLAMIREHQDTLVSKCVCLYFNTLNIPAKVRTFRPLQDSFHQPVLLKAATFRHHSAKKKKYTKIQNLLLLLLLQSFSEFGSIWWSLESLTLQSLWKMEIHSFLCKFQLLLNECVLRFRAGIWKGESADYITPPSCIRKKIVTTHVLAPSNMLPHFQHCSLVRFWKIHFERKF